ncbi:MAG TPA: lamin tail domain-containing protein [Verrucomicrobiae bacterium]|nr:lamin tail domain-containing protein [Verrucomicrobiae bacterium]
MRPLIKILFIASGLLLACASTFALTITLDPQQPGRVFEGIGAVSAGASSRLLIDYPEPQRSQILDYLFKPNYGAALQHLKVEIGGGVNSTDGTEPTHMRTPTDQNYSRGYEWWLMTQAAARNTNIALDCLAWGAPGWIGNGNYYSQDMCNYIANFLHGFQTNYNLSFSFTGTHNESTINTSWIKQLRSTLDANGLQNVQLVAADEAGGTWKIVTNTSYGLLVDPALSNAVARIGSHYPGSTSPAAAQTCGKPLWASEDGIGGSSWAAARKLGQIFNSNYVTGKMTCTEIWSPTTAYYDNLPAANSGLMRANTPWSGNYYVAPAIWVTAHTTQFAFPGWKYLEGGASAVLPGGGTIVTLQSTNGSDYSVVVETFGATNAQLVTFVLTNGLSTAKVNVWQTSQTSQFINVAQITPSNGSYSFTFQPECIYTLTTTTGQTKGGALPPAATSFPLPFKDNFESYAVPQTPKYFSDQAGTFETFTRADGQGQCLRQVLTQTGIRWTGEWQPYTLLGETSWTDYDVACDVLVETNGGFAYVMGRIGTIPGFSNPLPPCYWLALNNAAGAWQLYAATNLIASGPATFPANSWHNVRLTMRGSSLSCYVDGALATNVTDYTYSSGLAGIGCGWHAAQFDNFLVRGLHSSTMNMALSAVASASSIWSSGYTPAMANDGDLTTRWNTAYPTLSNEWLELDFPRPVTFSQTAYYQFASRIFGYQIQDWTGATWRTDFSGGTMGAFELDAFPPVTSSKVRLLLTNFTSAPSIYEFQVYGNTSAHPAITINEWMTNNTKTLADPADGQFHPWLELYNPGTTNVNLAGFYLSGSPTNLFEFAIPSGFSVPAGGFLLVWTDGLQSSNQPGATDLHVNFSLQQSSIIAVLDSSGEPVDAVTLGYQSPDTSSGSRMDGDLAILPLPYATPRHSNNQIIAFPPAWTGSNYVIGFSGFPFSVHQVQSTSSLKNATWSNTASITADGLGSFQYIPTNNQPSAFYRAMFP